MCVQCALFVCCWSALTTTSYTHRYTLHTHPREKCHSDCCVRACARCSRALFVCACAFACERLCDRYLVCTRARTATAYTDICKRAPIVHVCDAVTVEISIDRLNVRELRVGVSRADLSTATQQPATLVERAGRRAPIRLRFVRAHSYACGLFEAPLYARAECVCVCRVFGACVFVVFGWRGRWHLDSAHVCASLSGVCAVAA